jgi:trans-AT polyketide synthase/acyltransferase/oxidoreductase domain-containing protein
MLDAIDIPAAKLKRQGNLPDISASLSTPVFFVEPEMLGSKTFKQDYGIKYAYLAGAMYKGIASKELVVAMSKAGLMAYLGTGGLTLEEIDHAINFIKTELKDNQPYGMNLLCNPIEMHTVELYLRHCVHFIEVSGYKEVTPALLRYRLSGVRKNTNGEIETPNRVLLKASSPEVVENFMRPAPTEMVKDLLAAKHITETEAELAKTLPVARDICVEADSGGHTERGNAYILIPAIRLLRDKVMAEQAYHPSQCIHMGTAGGIGTPEAAVAAFMLGADFVLTGSINQCTVEAGISDDVKDILQELTVRDTDYIPADMAESRTKIQVATGVTAFPERANKLAELYRAHNSIEEIDDQTQTQLQNIFFKRSFDEIWAETQAYYHKTKSNGLKTQDFDSRQKMASIFRWYFFHTAQLAMNGDNTNRSNYQVHCGPALGAFNQWIKGTAYENWRNRHVAEIADLLMQETAQLLQNRLASIHSLARQSSG